jgi:hypothetical protein
LEASTTVPSVVLCPKGYDYIGNGTCLPLNVFTDNSNGGLTTAQAMGVGVVIGAFVMAFILIGGFFLLRRKRGKNGRKNAVIVVTESEKSAHDEERKDFS